MRRLRTLAWLGGTCVLAGALVAGVLFPVVGGLGLVTTTVSASVDSVSTDLQTGTVAQTSTMLDSTGKPIAYFWGDQRRTEVASDKISRAMKLAVVSIEDKRFYSNDGVDWRGTLRAAVTNATAGSTQQGASTITQQYVKNYELLVLATTSAEQSAATADTAARKIRDVRVALTLDQKLGKDEILTRYLNLVPFGNGAYGIQAAAQTYFGINAVDLTVPQSAMLAGMVQSSSALNPYTNVQGVTERRNTVLDTMAANGVIPPSDADAAKATPLGVLAEAASPSNGCIGAGDNGFFCDYALQYLATAGISQQQVDTGGLTIHTTLDPTVQASTKAGLVRQAPADLDGIANVLDVVQPGTTAHKVLAMASSRTYGLDAARHETVLGQPYSLEGDGAGSVFKIFTTAAAMEKGLGINDVLDTPAQLQLKGFGDSAGSPGCPAKTYCVQNYSSHYKTSYPVWDALAQSPNTAFVKLISEVGVAPTVDMAVKLGMRSYGVVQPGRTTSIADTFKNGNQASFTLGVTPVNPVELSNVGATLASGGTWCPPTPVDGVTDSTGAAVTVNQQACERVVDPDLASSLANGLSHDPVSGTAAGAAKTVGWTLPLSSKTGTTNAEKSDAFLGFTNTVAGADIIFDDSGSPRSMCTSPLRHCPSATADLTGGAEPARSWFDAVSPVVGGLGAVTAPVLAPRYATGNGAFGQP
ncbi:penicillin-binding protein [Rhodococcus antarcticus]|uniref:Penicillin-binding protein n=1 Tax=Rhodococcus antarcticus TaxID=2987751 RepID=A0ABY6NZN8_9NOCA|nr:transglycosylase domain-containing protein [Rhodococcus antarcticus]UZJ24368.1 penicillin-binding protein [Rhodococcus antarcticus]